jgi:glycosyltransferase involved in cell wall biosynthesis
VDANLFNPANACEWKQGSVFRIASCSWSSNPAKGHERIALFSTFPGVEVSHAGHWPDTVSPRNVRLLGPLDQHGIASLFKRSHGFIFPAAHESCSNVLLEALAAGLPVLYADSGGNREIAGNYGTALDSGDERNVFERYKLHYAEYRRRILSERERFSIRHAGRNYLECIKKLLETSGGSHAPPGEVPRP